MSTLDGESIPSETKWDNPAIQELKELKQDHIEAIKELKAEIKEKEHKLEGLRTERNTLLRNNDRTEDETELLNICKGDIESLESEVDKLKAKLD